MLVFIITLLLYESKGMVEEALNFYDEGIFIPTRCNINMHWLELKMPNQPGAGIWMKKPWSFGLINIEIYTKWFEIDHLLFLSTLVLGVNKDIKWSNHFPISI